MANLAMKGHATRGKEVINLLEMLGANSLGYKDTFVGFYYYIECGAICSSDEYPTYATIFTLEEFLEKYPYKVGDKVLSYNKWVGVIESMEWYRGEVLYHVRERNNCLSSETVEHLQYYIDTKVTNKEVIMKKNQPPKTQAEVDKYLQEHPIKNTMNVMDIESCLETDGLKLSENVVINSKGIGSIQFIQWYEKHQYPKTYAECCKIMQVARPIVWFDYDDVSSISKEGDEYVSRIENILYAFRKLLICRDAYWEIAGKELGLDKPWKQDYDDKCFIIVNSNGDIRTYEYYGTNNIILAFPTAEMRDVFYDNFKELIEFCKELL